MYERIAPPSLATLATLTAPAGPRSTHTPHTTTTPQFHHPATPPPHHAAKHNPSSTLISKIRDAGGLERTWDGTTYASVSDVSVEIYRGGEPSALPTVSLVPTILPTAGPTSVDAVSVDASVTITNIAAANVTDDDLSAVAIGVARIIDGVNASDVKFITATSYTVS